jgi:7-carboxy-7-deazaguanine synthase
MTKYVIRRSVGAGAFFSPCSCISTVSSVLSLIMVTAFIDEIFSSVQGEGPRIGERHIFVRFQGCHIRCRFCDTPAAIAPKGDVCRAQRSLTSWEQEEVPNPMATDRLTELCMRLAILGHSRPVLSLTGGEPLLQQDFLSVWLPQVRPAFTIYLETNGIQFETLQRVVDSIDVISMDIKLPSATGLRPFWEEHRKFLAASRGKECFVKAVITNETSREDIVTAARIISDFDPSVPFILQPSSGKTAPPPAILLAFQEIAQENLGDVRVIPQVHKMLQVP